MPGLYLTGNGPLAEVLQYELRQAGGGGQTFVRHIKSYLDRYVPRPELVPPEHLLVFDEAQRAFSPEKVADTHPNWRVNWIASEPELFLRVCERMPGWSVLVGLIGGGQEIHLGEEEGLIQWRSAIDTSEAEWTVHAPDRFRRLFLGSRARFRCASSLSLDVEVRFHGAKGLHELVEAMLDKGDTQFAFRVSEDVRAQYGNPVERLHLYVTRDLDTAKWYLRERYAESPRARFGLLASSRDKDLPAFGINNDFQATKRVRLGPWFTAGEDDERSCRRLEAAVTEFGCQGLELEMALVAWGTDLMRENGQWTIHRARPYRARGRVTARSPLQMRLNAYRVLLTRGRDGTIVFVPPLEELNETAEYLEFMGFTRLSMQDLSNRPTALSPG